MLYLRKIINRWFYITGQSHFTRVKAIAHTRERYYSIIVVRASREKRWSSYFGHLDYLKFAITRQAVQAAQADAEERDEKLSKTLQRRSLTHDAESRGNCARSEQLPFNYVHVSRRTTMEAFELLHALERDTNSPPGDVEAHYLENPRRIRVPRRPSATTARCLCKIPNRWFYVTAKVISSLEV